MIVGIVGLIGSGKDTAADHLVNRHGFKRDSFAAPVKDTLSAVFGWDRDMLEGRTPESRAWREKVDNWWATRLDIPNLTPRMMMQQWGTNVLRGHFHNDIWVASLENRLKNSKENIIITDARFPNEITSIRNVGGIIVRIKRGPDPEWYNDALMTNLGTSNAMFYRSDVHPSEWSWVGTPVDHVIENNGTVEDLYNNLELTLRGRGLSLPASTANPAYEVAVDNWHKLI